MTIQPVALNVHGYGDGVQGPAGQRKTSGSAQVQDTVHLSAQARAAAGDPDHDGD